MKSPQQNKLQINKPSLEEDQQVPNNYTSPLHPQSKDKTTENSDITHIYKLYTEREKQIQRLAYIRKEIN